MSFTVGRYVMSYPRMSQKIVHKDHNIDVFFNIEFQNQPFPLPTIG